MPNNGRITKCPYYVGEQNKSISCEDTFRRFRWPAQKYRWMDTYCDDKWEKCVYALAIQRAYEGGNMNKFLVLDEKNKALKKELKSVSTMLGKCEKRDKEKSAVIRDLQNRNRALESIAIKRQMELDETRSELRKAERVISGIGEIYEGRFAYLMAKNGYVLDEVDFKRWANTHEYAIKPSKEGENGTVEWIVVTREVENESKGPSAEGESAGGATNTKTDEVQEHTNDSKRD